MTDEEIQQFLQRIDHLSPQHKALFGQMSVQQMVCHCTDQLRVAMRIKVLPQDGPVDSHEIVAMAKAGKTVPTPKGLGQIEGDGTKPTDWNSDIKVLKQHLLDFHHLPEGFSYAPHPYFGPMNKKSWTRLVVWHLNHHLGQFAA